MIGVIDAGTTTVKLAIYDERMLVALEKGACHQVQPETGLC